MFRSWPARLAAVAALAVAATAGVLWIVPSDHFIVLPDRARPTDPLVRVPGEQPGTDENGIYMVDVRVGRASVFERLFPNIYDGAEVRPEEEFKLPGESDRERRERSLNQMTESQQVAIAVALESLGREVSQTGAQILEVEPDTPADGKLRSGDVIVGLEGQQVSSTDDVSRIMARRRPGDTVAVAIRRSGRLRELTVGTRPATDDKNRPIMGIVVRTRLEFPVGIRIDAGSIGGPSAGLAFALDIVDEFARDLDGGRRIVATGALEITGDVHPIGGIRQKTIGAKQAEADLFLVPDDNAAEARRNAGDLEVVAVSSFEEALSALDTK